MQCGSGPARSRGHGSGTREMRVRCGVTVASREGTAPRGGCRARLGSALDPSAEERGFPRASTRPLLEAPLPPQDHLRRPDKTPTCPRTSVSPCSRPGPLPPGSAGRCDRACRLAREGTAPRASCSLVAEGRWLLERARLRALLARSPRFRSRPTQFAGAPLTSIRPLLEAPIPPQDHFRHPDKTPTCRRANGRPRSRPDSPPPGSAGWSNGAWRLAREGGERERTGAATPVALGQSALVHNDSNRDRSRSL